MTLSTWSHVSWSPRAANMNSRDTAQLSHHQPIREMCTLRPSTPSSALKNALLKLCVELETSEGCEPPHLLAWPCSKPFSAPDSDVSVWLASRVRPGLPLTEAGLAAGKRRTHKQSGEVGGVKGQHPSFSSWPENWPCCCDNINFRNFLCVSLSEDGCSQHQPTRTSTLSGGHLHHSRATAAGATHSLGRGHLGINKK